MSRVIWIGCGSKKASKECAARDLYKGCLFKDRLAYAEDSESPFWIISAKYGLVDPDQWLPPYDLRLGQLPPVERAAWALCTVGRLLDELSDDLTVQALRGVHVELHMGSEYSEPLGEVLLAAGMSTSWPVQNMGIGQQRAWYRERSKRERRRKTNARLGSGDSATQGRLFGSGV